MSSEKKARDTRSHSERWKALNSAFTRLKAIAVESGKKTDASAENVLKEAGVHRSYFYQKAKLKDEDTLQKYHDIRDTIQDFQDNFDSFYENSASKRIEQKLEAKTQELNQTLIELVSSERRVVAMQAAVSRLKQQSQIQNDHLLDAVHSSKVKTLSATASFSQPIIVSPDKHCYRDGKYLWSDSNVRESAWHTAKNELIQALKRPLAVRVYVLIGAPASGKTTWSNHSNNYFPDMHSITIDATNLTYTSRLEWMLQINKFKESREIRVCAVVFLTPVFVLQRRNALRDSERQLSDQVLAEKSASMEFPDLNKEEFDELIVVRHGDE